MISQPITGSAASGVLAFAQQAQDNLIRAHDAIIASRVHQTHHANQRRRDEDVHHGDSRPIVSGDLVYLSTENLSLPKYRARKLCPRYIGPYKVLSASRQNSTYTLDLPEELKRRGIHPTFHDDHRADDNTLDHQVI